MNECCVGNMDIWLIIGFIVMKSCIHNAAVWREVCLNTLI